MSSVLFNEEESPASFCLQVVAWVTDVFCNFYLVKNLKISDNSTTTKSTEKIGTNLEALEFQEIFYACLTKFKNNQILLN